MAHRPKCAKLKKARMLRKLAEIQQRENKNINLGRNLPKKKRMALSRIIQLNGKIIK